MSADKRTVALHEAAHAVIALALGLRVLRVEIRDERLLPPIPNFVGSATVEAPDGHHLEDRDQTLNRLVVCMAADVAENIDKKSDPRFLVTASGDIDWALTKAAEKLPGVDNAKQIVDAAIMTARALLSQPAIWGAVTALADELLRVNEMNEAEVIRAVSDDGPTG